MSPLADTTVLNNFAQIRRPDLLRGAWPDLAAPIPLDLTEQEQVRADEVGRALDPGEAACITVANSRVLLMFSDDWEARALGRSFGIEVSGSLGALDRLVWKQTLSFGEADALLAEMVRRGSQLVPGRFVRKTCWKEVKVEQKGFEPSTPTLRTWCSPN